MKQLLTILVLLTLVAAGGISYAQNSVFAGKIVDENGKPEAWAQITVSKGGVVQAAITADKDGLYNSPLMPYGVYLVSVHADSKVPRSTKIKLEKDAGSKKFFLVKIGEKKMTITSVDRDPAMAVKLNRIEEEQKRMDYPTRGMYIRRRDTSTMYSPAEKAPK